MNNSKKNIYALLDFDGFICKSYFANKEDMTNIESAKIILNNLKNSAIEKTANYFGVNKSNVIVVPIMSGHSWKKDLYPSYKRTRTRDEFLGLYREEIKKDRGIVFVNNLEADELLIVMHQYLRALNVKHIIFSDDKDLKYYATDYCKINITEEPELLDEVAMWSRQLEQMMAGDSEDNIKGIPKIGMKTAEKILTNTGYSIESVIREYKNRDIDIDSCLRDLLLIIPMSEDYIDNTETIYKLALDVLENNKELYDIDANNAIISQVQFLNKKVTEVYNEI